MPDDDVLDAEEPRPRRSLLDSLSRTSSGRAPREARPLDDTERKWGWAAAAIGILTIATLVPYLLHNTIEYEPESLSKASCHAHGYRWLDGACSLKVVYTPGHYQFPFALYVVCAVVLVGAIVVRKRSLAVLAALFGFFALGLMSILSIPSVVLVVFAIWLLMRAWRYSKYGTTSAKEVRQMAVERSDQRRADRKAQRSSSGDATPSTSSRGAPTPSKRYTPSKSKSKAKRR